MRRRWPRATTAGAAAREAVAPLVVVDAAASAAAATNRACAVLSLPVSTFYVDTRSLALSVAAGDLDAGRADC
jgi:hypothetical protein